MAKQDVEILSAEEASEWFSLLQTKVVMAHLRDTRLEMLLSLGEQPRDKRMAFVDQTLGFQYAIEVLDSMKEYSRG